MKRSALIAFSACLALHGAHARAEGNAAPPSAEAVDQAREHFQRGVDFYKDQSFDAALAEFTRAYELAANYRVLYNLGQVQLERHDYVAALKFFRGYLDAGGAEIADQRREQVERDVSTLKTRVAQLQIKCDVEGAEVSIDGATVAHTPVPAALLVNPGVVHVSVQKAGYASETRTFTLTSNETKDLTFTLQAQSAAHAEPAHPATAPLPPTRAVAERSHAPVWVSLGVTGVFAVGAGVFALRTHSANSALDRELDTYPGSASKISDARTTLKSDALATDVLTGCAAVAAGFTLYFALSSPSEPSTQAGGIGLRSLAAAKGVELFGNF